MAGSDSVTIANRYELQEILGRGGMGEVYRAYDRLTQTPVAIKKVRAGVYSPAPDSDESSHDPHIALAQEFQILARLRHPHIVSVLDYSFDKDQPYLTMQLLENAQTLDKAASNLSVSGRINLLGQVLEALGYLHQHGILHRDLKPGNVLVVDGVVKVLDFGVALAAHDRTGADRIVGTLSYMAPELLQGDPPTVESDLYSFGVMAYQVFAGRHPFRWETQYELLEDILSSDPDATPLEDYSVRLKMGTDVAADDEPTTLMPERVVNIVANNTSESTKGYSPLTNLILRLLDKSPNHRPGDARATLRELYKTFDLPVPRESMAVRESYLKAAKFVGRRAELSQLSGFINQAKAGKGSICLVGGESGVGKSRLLDELRVYSKVSDVEVLRGKAVEGAGLPYQVWRDVVPQLVLNIEISDLEAGVIKEIVPTIATLLGREIPDAPELPGQAAQDRLLLVLVEILRRQTKPLLLILEDLQWTNEGMLPLKRFEEEIANYPIMILGSYRSDEKPTLPEELPTAVVIVLERLGAGEIAELASAMLGKQGKNAELVQLLARETEGNTFFMVEAARMLAEEAGSLIDVGDLTLPKEILTGGMQELLRRRIAAVPAQYQPLLQLAAVVGRQINQDVLRVCEPETDLGEWLQACEAAAVFDVLDDNWQFAHHKIRETLIAEIPADTSAQMHRRVARAIESLYPDNWEYNEVLLEHWCAAGDVDKHLHYLNLVARRQINITAEYTTAYRLLERGMAQIADTDPRRVGLLNWVARARWKQGQYAEAEGAAQQAKTLAESIGDEAGIASSKNYLGLVAWEQGQYDLAENYYQQSLALREKLEDQAGIAASLSNLGNVYQAKGDVARAQEFYERSAVIQETLEDRWGLSSTLNNLGAVTAMQGKFDPSLAFFERSRALREEMGDKRGLAATLNNLGFVAYLNNQFDTAQDYYWKSLAIGESIGDTSGVVHTLNNIGSLQVQMKQDDAAIQTLARSLSMARALGMIPLILEIFVSYAQIFARRERSELAAEIIGFVSNHPANNQELRQNCENLMPVLRQTTAPDALQGHLDKGAALELEAVAESIARET